MPATDTEQKLDAARAMLAALESAVRQLNNGVDPLQVSQQLEGPILAARAAGIGTEK